MQYPDPGFPEKCITYLTKDMGGMILILRNLTLTLACKRKSLLDIKCIR